VTKFLLVIEKPDVNRCEMCVALTPSPYSDAIVCKALSKVIAHNVAIKDIVTPTACPLKPYDYFKQK
jgi:hypothetical protein